MPIIKSTGRKDRNFRQLIDYLHRDDGGGEETFTYLHNIQSSDPGNLQAMEEAFVKNSVHQRRRANGIGQYHEIISFDAKDAHILQENPQILEDIARVYLELRAPHAVAIAKPHIDKDHIHLHVMISPNDLGSSKNIRLSKAEFSALRRTMEEYQLAIYPELKHSYVHSRDRYRYQYEREQREQHQQPQPSSKSRQMLKRKAKQSLLETCSQGVQNALAAVTNEVDFCVELQKMGMTAYEYRNRLNGIIYNGKKYRFSRLLEPESSARQQIERWNTERKEKAHQRGHGLDFLQGL